MQAVSESVNARSKPVPNSEPATNSRKHERIWPLGWLILEWIATVGWLCAIAWAGVRFIQWVFGYKNPNNCSAAFVTFSRSDFRYDPANDVYHCPGGKRLGTSGTVHEGKTLLYRASKLDCDVCPLKPQCCPKEPARKIPRDIHEHARDIARSFAGTEGFEQSQRERKKIEMRFAHLKRILKLSRLRLRGPRGAQDEFVLAAIAQNLRRLATLVARPPPAQVLCIA